MYSTGTVMCELCISIMNKMLNSIGWKSFNSNRDEWVNNQNKWLFQSYYNCLSVGKSKKLANINSDLTSSEWQHKNFLPCESLGYSALRNLGLINPTQERKILLKLKDNFILTM